MAEVSHQNQEREEIKKRNIKVLLIVGGAILISVAIFTALTVGLFYFHIFNLANVVSGD